MQVSDLVEIDSESEAFRTEPVAVLDALRPAWAARSARGVEIFSYRGIEAAYRNPGVVAGVVRTMHEMGLDSEELVGSQGANLLTNETPEHDRLRRIVARWFTPRSVAALVPRLEQLCSDRVTPLTENGGGELMSEIARHMPGAVFCWMLGVPDEHGSEIFELSEVILRTFDGRPEDVAPILAAAADLRALIDGMIDEKRRNPQEDLLTVLLDAEASGEITMEDVHSISFEMLGASTDNTAHSAGLAVSVFCAHPDQWQAVRADPSILENALEECARVEPRIRCHSTWVPDGTDLIDLELPPDTSLWQHTAAAHVDPEVFPDPHTIDVTRPLPTTQLNFGVGRHFCLGAALARMELRTLFGVLLKEWSSFETAAEPVIERGDGAASVRELRIRCTPSRAA